MSDVTDVVDAQLDAYNARDLERFVACYVPEAVITNAKGDVLAQGHDGIRNMYAARFENDPHINVTIRNRIVVDRFIADHEVIEGITLPGSPNSLQAIVTYQVIDGLISRATLYF